MIINSTSTHETITLFAYGTLCDADVQLRLFNTVLPSSGKASLKGWRKYTHLDYPFIKPSKNDVVEGTLLRLTSAQLKIADQWEEYPEVYQREKVWANTEKGTTCQAWVYTRREAE